MQMFLFTGKKFEENHIKPNDIKSLDDLKQIPFTTKEDLRDNYPFGMFAVPMDNVVRIHASSGTYRKAHRCGVYGSGY